MKNYIDIEVDKRISELRDHEDYMLGKYGSLKRIYKLLGANFEIKFCKAKMLLNTALEGKEGKAELQIRVYEYGKGKLAYICDYDDEKANMIKQYEKETDVVFFSMEELLRCIPSEFMDAKRLLTKKFGDANFERIKHG